MLLVEDDAAVRALLVSTLERQGYRVTATSTSAAAMAALSQPLHALIVDLGLPEGGGEELAATIAERAAGLPTVYVSGAAATAGLGRRIREAERSRNPSRPAICWWPCARRSTKPAPPPAGPPPNDPEWRG